MADKSMFRLIPNTVTALMARAVFLCVGKFPERTLSVVVFNNDR